MRFFSADLFVSAGDAAEKIGEPGQILRACRLKPAEAMRLLNSYERALKGYTYLTFNGGNGGPK